jgi:hypothetical protein
MLFVAEYELGWDALEAVMAKRLEWDEVKPDNFRFVGEYVWQDHDPAFRGVAIIETDSVEALNSFALHYGPTLKIRVHPASDVVSAIGAAGGDGRSAARIRRPGKGVRRRR